MAQVALAPFRERATPFRGVVGTTLVGGALVTGLNFLALAILAPVATLAALPFAGVVCGALVFYFLYLADDYPSRRMALGMAFLWGSCAATGLAILVNTVSTMVSSETLTTVVLAPLGEEAFKGAFLLALILWRRHQFSGPLDGLVYGGMIGAGFAFVENITYFVAAALDQGAALFMLTVTARAGTLFLHSLFTGLLGLAIGLALQSSGLGRWIYGAGGFMTAVGLHSAWNGTSTFSTGAWGFWLIYGAYVSLSIAFMVVGYRLKRHHEDAYTHNLGELVALGHLTPVEAHWLSTARQRERLRAWADAQAPAHRRLMLQQQEDALNFIGEHMRVRKYGMEPRSLERGHHYLAQVKAARPQTRYPAPGNFS